MLILSSSQVKHAQVISASTQPPQLLEAIAYQGAFFTKGESFSLGNRSVALKRVQDILEIDRGMAMLLEESSQLTVYYLNPEAIPLNDDPQLNQKLISSLTSDTAQTGESTQQKTSRLQQWRQTLDKNISIFKKK